MQSEDGDTADISRRGVLKTLTGIGGVVGGISIGSQNSEGKQQGPPWEGYAGATGLGTYYLHVPHPDANTLTRCGNTYSGEYWYMSYTRDNRGADAPLLFTHPVPQWVREGQPITLTSREVVCTWGDFDDPTYYWYKYEFRPGK